MRRYPVTLTRDELAACLDVFKEAADRRHNEWYHHDLRQRLQDLLRNVDELEPVEPTVRHVTNDNRVTLCGVPITWTYEEHNRCEQECPRCVELDG